MAKLIITVDTSDLEVVSNRLTAIRAGLFDTVGVSPVLAGRLKELQKLIDEECAIPSITVTEETDDGSVFVLTEAEVAEGFDDTASLEGAAPWATQPDSVKVEAIKAVREYLGKAAWGEAVAAVVQGVIERQRRTA